MGPWSEAFGQSVDFQERMRRVEEEETEQVDRLYSEKPVRVILGPREYVIPANYFGPKELEEPDTFKAEGYFGFFLFFPNFGGYTKENWRDRFDTRLIHVTGVSLVDRNAMIPYFEGGRVKITPANYGEPKAQFENRKSRLEERPSFDIFSLKGYRWRGAGTKGTPGITWTGTRSNGEFFFFESSLAPGEPKRPGITNPLCTARYFSEKEDLHVRYFYSQDHLDKWKQIDDAIWAKLHRWRVA
jgi:hypothetical protein